jgi:hypothetical protein
MRRYDFAADGAVSALRVWGLPLPEVVRPLEDLSICILILADGRAVVGSHSPAPDEDWSAAGGREAAYQNALSEAELSALF